MIRGKKGYCWPRLHYLEQMAERGVCMPGGIDSLRRGSGRRWRVLEILLGDINGAGRKRRAGLFTGT